MADIVTIFLITVTAIAAATPIIAIFYQKQRKALAYEILSVSPLLTGNELQGRVTIQFDHRREVQNIYLVIIKLINSGNIPITATDFEGPIKILFDRQNEILSAEVTEKNPPNLEPILTVTQDGLILSPLLLNNGDNIVIKTLLTSYTGDIQINGRIAGIKDIQKAKEQSFPLIIAFAGMILSLAGFSLSLMINEALLAIIILIVGYLMILYAIGKRKKYRKIMNRLAGFDSKNRQESDHE